MCNIIRKSVISDSAANLTPTPSCYDMSSLTQSAWKGSRINLSATLLSVFEMPTGRWSAINSGDDLSLTIAISSAACIANMNYPRVLSLTIFEMSDCKCYVASSADADAKTPIRSRK